MESLPFFIQPGSFDLLPSARILLIRTSDTAAEIDVMGIVFKTSFDIALRSDFGQSAPRRVLIEDVKRAVDSSPAKFLHPTMNAEFLCVAVLRVAVCARDNGNLQRLLARNDLMYQLWSLLIDLEKLCGFDDAVLAMYMIQYLDRHIDLSMLKTAVLHRLEDMSRLVTEPFQAEENIIKLGARKALGKIRACAIGSLIFGGGFKILLIFRRNRSRKWSASHCCRSLVVTTRSYSVYPSCTYSSAQSQ